MDAITGFFSSGLFEQEVLSEEEQARIAQNAANLTGRIIDGFAGLVKALGYHEVGRVDGEIGPRTRAAILAFRDDTGLPLVPIIDVALAEALAGAEPRLVTPERATGVPETSRILTAANAQVGLGVIGAAGSVTAQIAPALVQAEEARDTAERVLDLVGLTDAVQVALPWIGAAVFIGVIFYALKARNARIEDHRSGKTP